MKQQQFVQMRPVNRQAAMVAFWPGDNWEPMMSERQAWFAQSMPTVSRPIDACEKYAHVPGMRRGLLTALCFHGVNRNGKPLWLMRCDCGRYTFRYIKGWIKRPGVYDCCAACEYTNSITRPSPSRQTHGVRRVRWMQSLISAGFSQHPSDLIEQYGLSCEDLTWLKGAVSEIEGLIRNKGGRT